MGEPGCGDRALLAARAWLGTPYRHGASVRGEASDCLGLVRGVWRELYGAEPQAVPAYRPDWAETGGPETLLEAAARWFSPRPLAAAAPGDVVLFRMNIDDEAGVSARPRRTHRSKPAPKQAPGVSAQRGRPQAPRRALW